ncbi:tetratricopeptide repeat protein [Pseudoalteromonas piscicida]|uniref:tetratricopeptide repeat protein n=1 Tax=Pseudoalteromonas piscicida TaxID=43662 RepID=UPI0021D49C56|nr:tetratricopeptide repeat protein [Pseudoalteromonas piscicida]
MYEYGQGVAQSDKKAVEYFQLAAEQGEAGAQFNLGVMYERGKGVAQSDEKAVEYFQLAAEQGDADAQCNLGVMYEFGQGVAQSDEKAVEYYRLAAEQGNASGQFCLGVMYRQGKGVAQSDEKAVEYYRLAAEQGNALAQCNLGNLYRQGKGVAQSDDKAVEYYRLAVAQGDARGQCNLGLMYINGKGVAQSDEKAVKYFRLAAEQENVRALFSLAYCYFQGKGVTQSFTETKALCEQVFKDPLLSFEAYELHDRAERFEQSKSISVLREEILSHLKVSKNLTMTHYTAFDVGQAILLEKSPFRLGHINAVNDPNEGKLLWQELGYEPEEGNPVFIGCFLPDSDSLNMWRFYSKNHLNDDACGCAITYNTERFFDYRLIKDQSNHTEQEPRVPSFANTGQSPQESAAFYRVVYLKNNFKILGRGATILQTHFEALKKEVDKFVGKKPTPEKLQTLAWLLGPLPYLLKDANYKDEQEHRVIVTHLDYGAKEIKSEDPDFANGKAPRLYLELHRDDHLAPIEYVTLGPKAPNKEMMASYWRHQLASKFESQLERRKGNPLNINPSRCAYK